MFIHRVSKKIPQDVLRRGGGNTEDPQAAFLKGPFQPQRLAVDLAQNQEKRSLSASWDLSGSTYSCSRARWGPERTGWNRKDTVGQLEY